MRFDQPQRQSKIGIAVESGLFLFNTIKGAWPILLVFYFRAENINLIYIAAGLSVLLLIVLLIGFLTYLNTSFYIDKKKQEFILHRGIFNKQRVVVSLSKIQQVNINQDFIHKLFDIYSVGIDTAGSAGNEAKINAISEHTAQALQLRLLESTENEQRLTDQSTVDNQPFIQIGLGSLFKIGITSRYLESFTLLLAFFYAVYTNVKDIWWNDDESEAQFNQLLGTFFGVQSALILLGGFMVLILLFNLIRTLITYYGFQIGRSNHSLLISYGLFNTKNTIIKPDKVQITKISRNYFQRQMDLFQITVHQPSSDIQTDKKAKIQIPGCNTAEQQRLFDFIYGRNPEKGFVLKPNIRKTILPVVLFCIFPLLSYAIAQAYTTLPLYYHGIAILYLLLVTIMICVAYSNNRLYVHNDFILKKSGIWDVKTEILQPFKIQAITSKQYPWHRKNDIGHIILHTAGGDIRFSFGNFTRLKEQINWWLYQTESSKKEWM